MGVRGPDEGVLRNKLDAIEKTRATLGSIEDLDEARLTTDPVTAAAVERLLCRLVDLAVEANTHVSAAVLQRAPGDYRESFDFAREAGALTAELAERLKPSVGMRNTIVHEYVGVDYAIVADTVPIALDAYAEYRREMAGFMSTSR